MNETIARFCENYMKVLEDGHAGLFVGAGLSKPAGFVEWKELLRKVADEIGLSIDTETDFITLAQYHVNEHGGNRHRLNALLLNEFARDAEPLENHRLIAQLPLRTIWTTNYDQLIERSFREAYKRLDVKITKENLALPLPKRDAILYKMHGCVTQPHDAVLIKEDYETYNDKRALFSELLRGDLISNTFLFLGFSFTDPNIDYVLSRIRALLGTNQPQHYWIVKRVAQPTVTGERQEVYEYEKRKQELRVNDLKRYGIQALLIDDYPEISKMLRELNCRVNRKNIFVSGSAYEYAPMDRERTESLAKAIGHEIIIRGYNLISGLGLGIGSAVMLGAAETVYSGKRISAEERMHLRPFPRHALQGMTKEEFNTNHRRDIVSTAGIVIFLSGNNRDLSGNHQSVVSEGVLEEFRVTKELGKRPIPVGATGHAARQIWEEVYQSLDEFYPEGGIEEYFAVLGDETKTNGEIINAIFAIAQRITP